MSSQTMSNWILKASEVYLEPVYAQLHRKPQSKSYMWLYRTSGDAEHPVVMYEY